MNSPIQLATTIDGILPDRYAFYGNLGRSFRTEFASTANEYSIVLFERADERSYENCFARGLFEDLERLAKVIHLWSSEQKDISEIKLDFDELEIYEDFDFQNPDPNIDQRWTKVRNMFFNDTGFWKEQEWNKRYVEMLIEAKRHEAFAGYFPLTSHYWLRFSINQDLTETWPLYLNIIPTRYSEEIPESSGKYYVSFNDSPMGGQFFEEVKDALDFYADKLKETHPTKWVTE